MALPHIIGVSMFNISKKGGYEIEEVNHYLARQKQETSHIVSSLRNINSGLKKENDELLAELNEYRKRDSLTASETIIADAEKKADEIVKASQETFLLEIKKVQKVYEELVDTIKYVELKYGIEPDDKMILTRFKTQIKKILYDCLDKDEEQADATVSLKSADKARLSGIEIKPKEMLREEPVYTSKSEEVINMTDNLNAAIWHESEVERINRLKTRQFKSATEWLDEKQAIDEKAGEESTGSEKLRLGRTMTNSKIYGVQPSFEETMLDNRNKQVEMTESKHDAYARLINKYLKKPLSEANFVDTVKAPVEKGFNMRDALVNKQSLDEIMQSFDFYTQD